MLVKYWAVAEDPVEGEPWCVRQFFENEDSYTNAVNKFIGNRFSTYEEAVSNIPVIYKKLTGKEYSERR